MNRIFQNIGSNCLRLQWPEVVNATGTGNNLNKVFRRKSYGIVSQKEAFKSCIIFLEIFMAQPQGLPCAWRYAHTQEIPEKTLSPHLWPNIRPCTRNKWNLRQIWNLLRVATICIQIPRRKTGRPIGSRQFMFKD